MTKSRESYIFIKSTLDMILVKSRISHQRTSLRWSACLCCREFLPCHMTSLSWRVLFLACWAARWTRPVIESPPVPETTSTHSERTLIKSTQYLHKKLSDVPFNKQTDSKPSKYKHAINNQKILELCLLEDIQCMHDFCLYLEQIWSLLQGN